MLLLAATLFTFRTRCNVLFHRCSWFLTDHAAPPCFKRACLAALGVATGARQRSSMQDTL